MLSRVATVLLGRQIAVYHGVAVRDRPPLRRRDHEPDHKQLLTAAVCDELDAGEEVVFVGGGRCVAPVHAARAGADVTVYEAGHRAIEVAASAQALNDVEFELRHAVVGTPGTVAGTPAATHVEPGELSGDTVVLDCEGAERAILRDLPADAFDRIIIETHPEQDSPLSTLREHLPGPASVVGPDPIDGQVVVA